MKPPGRRYTISASVVFPSGNRSLSSRSTLVDSALFGRKLSVSLFVSSASLLPGPANAAASTSQRATTSHLVRRPVTNAASALMGLGLGAFQANRFSGGHVTPVTRSLSLMSLLQLPSRDRLETLLVSGLGKLPSRAQLLLSGGRRVRIDGQELEPEVQLTLTLMKLSRRPSFEELPLDEARDAIRRDAALYSGATIPVGTVEEAEIPGAEGPLAVRLYVPDGLPSPAPLLVYLHGGGWVVGDLDTHDQPCRFLAQEAGVRVLSVDYRLAPEHPFPAGLDDAVAALRFAIEEAARFDADPARIAVGGDSAGGNLAAAAARLLALEGGPAPAFQLLIYPVTDLSRKRASYELFSDGFFLTARQMDWYRDHYLPDPSAAADPRVSPILASNLAGLPPGACRHRRLRRAARRGRGVRGAAPRCRRAGHQPPRARADPRIHARSRERARAAERDAARRSHPPGGTFCGAAGSAGCGWCYVGRLRAP